MLPDTNNAPVPEFVIAISLELLMSPEIVKLVPLLVRVVKLPLLTKSPDTVKAPELFIAVTVPTLLSISPESVIPFEPSFVKVIEPVPSATFFIRPSRAIPSLGPYEVIEITPLLFLRELPAVPSPSMFTN